MKYRNNFGYKPSSAAKALKPKKISDAQLQKMQDKLAQDTLDRAMEILITCSLITLKDEFGFSANKDGTGRLDRYLDRLRTKIACLYDKNAEVTIVDYIKYLEEETGLRIITQELQEEYSRVGLLED